MNPYDFHGERLLVVPDTADSPFGCNPDERIAWFRSETSLSRSRSRTIMGKNHPTLLMSRIGYHSTPRENFARAAVSILGRADSFSAAHAHRDILYSSQRRWK